MTLPGFDSLYKVTQREKNVWGDRWCGPDRYEHGVPTLIARFPKACEDGQAVQVFCSAYPAQFFTLEVAASFDSLGKMQPAYEIRTGSIRKDVVERIAYEIANGSFGVYPVEEPQCAEQE